MRTRLSVIGFCALAVGCAPSASPSDTDVIQEGISSSTVHVLGALQFGQTSNIVHYVATPKYSAFSFVASKGDAVEIWVRSPDHSGDAVALLLDSSYKEIAYNGNANRNTNDAHIVFNFSKGTKKKYYVAFRDYRKLPANFTVQLIGPNGIGYQDTRITQADIDLGRYATDQLNEFGDVVFNHVFTVDEGLGNALASAPGGGSGTRPNGRQIHNGKFGGPDGVGKACGSCHTQIGDDGGGLNESNIFQDGDGINLASALVRNPIALLGNGYVQELGIEMTAELQRLRDDAVAAAKAQGAPVTRALVAKGIDFGSLVANADGTLDASGLRGVDADLVVKPFGWKGRVASLRRFVEGGFQVHFGMATDVLVAKNCAKPAPDVVGNGPDCHDPDADGVLNEITEGQLTSMAIYATLRQAPIRINPTAAAALARVQQGEQLFTQAGCANCHTPTLTLDRPIHAEAPDLTGAAPFQLDLLEDTEDPKLGANADGSVTVPLYSDLKRHDLGAALYDPHPTFKTFPANVFLTPPLWGVAVTAPYLHDGRAPTLTDAIAAHDGEAASSRSAFAGLYPDDQQKLLEFLGTLSRDPEHAN